MEKKINDICGWSTQRGNYPKPPLLLELIVFQAVSFEFIFSFCCTSSQESKALAKRTRKSMQVDGSLQNQYLRMELRWVAKRIRKSARKLQIFYAHTDDLQSTCIDLRWVAKRWKTCVDLRANLSSTKVDASQRKWVAKTVWPGLNESPIDNNKCVESLAKNDSFFHFTFYVEKWFLKTSCVRAWKQMAHKRC